MRSLQQRFLGRAIGWEYTYQVRGGWPFPQDMLRYDDARPATASDEALVRRLSSESAETVDDIRPHHTVTLVGRRRPTQRRWVSFVWRVV